MASVQATKTKASTRSREAGAVFQNAPAWGSRGADAPWLTAQLVTYLGNKRALLGPIGEGLARVRRRLGGRRLRGLDAFAGSGAVSRLLKESCHALVSNDLETYAGVLGRCFLANRSSVDQAELESWISELNRWVAEEPLPRGFIADLYAPRDDTAIAPGERVFYTSDNARRLDDYRRRIEGAPRELRDLLLGPLLVAASIHANTAGVFKGFYKDRTTGLGRFGGTGQDALSRIRGRIELRAPLLSEIEADVEVTTLDANALVRERGEFDVAYLDPPYNQHPYGSNYFMLNLLVDYVRPEGISQVSGIPPNWQRSAYNRRRQASSALEDLLGHLDARFLLVSYSDEGFVPSSEMRALLEGRGRVEEFKTSYPAFRGSRNFERRSLSVTEHLFLVECR
ncbi:MAG: DNA adenine methylase [Myxococcota bacterium]